MPTLLSAHFSLEEMTSTQVRNQENTPGSVEFANLTLLCENQLEQCRYLLGAMHVDSGYRSPEVNRIVGGAKTSQHMQGLACDFITLKMNLRDAYLKIMRSDIDYDQLIWEFGRWIHVSRAASGPSRKQALMIGSWTEGKYERFDVMKLP